MIVRELARRLRSGQSCTTVAFAGSVFASSRCWQGLPGERRNYTREIPFRSSTKLTKPRFSMAEAEGRISILGPFPRNGCPHGVNVLIRSAIL